MNKLVDLTYSEKQKTEIIINNFVIMLYNRNYFINGNLEELIKTGIKNLANNETFVKYDNKVFYLKIIPYKLNTIKKSEDIEKFINNHIDDKKIFTIIPGSNKIEKQLLEYDNTEVFNDVDLLVNIIDNNLVPKHILLSDDQAEEILTEYKIKKENLPRILSGDRIAKYYNIKPGQIVKIIRPSITAGEEIIYRVCVNGKIV
jgi:DNA-directed RNA polymerase subunit H (RpoH/RPB5)